MKKNIKEFQKTLTPKNTATANQKAVLVYADYNCTTGFGNVCKKIIDNLVKNPRNRVTIVAINDFTEKPYQERANLFVLPCLSISQGRKDPFARIEFLNMLYSMDWDLLFCINDPEFFSILKPHLDNVKEKKIQEKRKMFKSLLYAPIDSPPSKEDLDGFDFFNKVVLYTGYAKEMCKPLLSDKVFKKISVIPHGVDTDVFKPLGEDAITEIQKKDYPKDAFVFGTVNRNTARKDLSSLLIGFSMFKQKTNANAVLYMHTNPTDVMGVNLFKVASKLGLEVGKDIVFPEGFSENKGVSEERLNEIYNSFNCFITTTTAEGWGLSITEAMATKTLVVCPKHTAITEITDNGSNCFSFMFQQPIIFVNDAEKIRYICNPVEVANLFEVVYNLENEGEETLKNIQAIIDRAYDKVRKITWTVVNKKFETLFNNLLK